MHIRNEIMPVSARSRNVRALGFASALAGVLAAGILTNTAGAQCPGGYGPPPGSGERGNNGGGSGPSSPGPAGPSTPGPAAPTTPGPNQPNANPPAAPTTGGPRAAPGGGPRTGGVVPRAGAPGGPKGGPGGRGGTPMVFTHGSTSKKMLEIVWDYPVYNPPKVEGRTAAGVTALPAEQAFEYIANGDPRPLLVVRECTQCQGTDMALLSREFANERTLLLTSWFHCIKLPANVMLDNHPFRNLFPEHAHLFVAQANGAGRADFDGMQSQKQLWKVMSALLGTCYQSVGERNAEQATKDLLTLLAQFDVVDEKEERVLKDLDQELEQKGARSPRVAKLQTELRALRDEKTALLARERALRDLRVKPLAEVGAK